MKRSANVALLLMGTVAVGGTAYTLMPREDCSPDRPPITQPDGTVKTDCARRSSSSSSGGSSYHSSSSSSSGSRSGFFSSDSSSSPASHNSSSTHISGDGGSSVSRGGFGSFAHSFAAHFSGGG